MKRSASKQTRQVKPPVKFVDRSAQIMGAKELQMPPTDSKPIPQRKQLAGMG